MNVLVGVDGSERSCEAVEFAAQLLDSERDQVFLYCSAPHASSEVSTGATPVSEAADTLAERIFVAAKDALPLALRATVRTVTGVRKPAEGMMAAAENVHADLLVVGAHDVSKSLPLFVGGSTRTVAHQAQIPVLVVRPKKQASTHPFKLCIACDDGRWQHALNTANQLTWPEDTETILLHAVESEDVETVDEARTLEPFRQRLKEEHQTLLDELQQTADAPTKGRSLPKSLSSPKFDIVRGSAVDKIIEHAKIHETDLIIVAARRLGPMDRLLGSATEGLLLRSPCSLLVVHEPLPV